MTQPATASLASVLLKRWGIRALSPVGVAPLDRAEAVGDEDGVVVCPAALWDEALAEIAAREALECYIRTRIAAGESLRGLYPPDAAVHAAFARWRDAGERDP